MKKDKKPSIRFKEFTEAWEQRKLNELSNIYDGTHQTPNYKDNGIMFLSVENIKDLKSNKYISLEDFKKNFKIYPQKNDILMTRIGDIGTPNIVKDNTPIAYYVSLALIKPFNIQSSFLNVAIQSNYIQNGLRERSLLTAIPMKINKDQIGLVDVLYPKNENEQDKIGKLFENLDNLITLHQRKYDKLVCIKKSLLEKMFPQNGKNIPEIRFKEFTEAWEQRKLDDFGKSTGGVSIESEFSDKGKYKVISIGSYSETSTYNDQGIRCILSNRTRDKILNKDDLTMILNDKTASGNIIGRVLLIEKSGLYVYNQRTERIEVNKEKYDPLFIYELLNAPNIRNRIIKESQGNTQIYVNWTAVKELLYCIPKIEEQKKLGIYFKQLDNLITLHQCKLEKLKNLKKSLLNKMFV